ncbi:MAG: amino acid adenylation domain-containing protein, partial [Anaerolineae bacterium]
SLAYIIYTSGSTGKPKGVMIPHHGVLNHNLAVIDLFNLEPADRVWQFATINFDTAVEEIFPTLLTGATLVLRGDDVPPVSTLCRLIAEQQLTVLDLPTAYWHEWVNELAQSGTTPPDPLRLVVVGGEKASAAHLQQWQAVVDETAVSWLNTYGPTETTIIATAYRPDGPVSGEIPIGRPIANTQAYVLDAHHRPVPVGVPGELYIGGAGVGAGYLNRPELTAEKFVNFPNYELGIRNYEEESDFIIHNSSFIIYKTGDLARWLPDGNLEYLGRADHLVKIRGFRIELGEIEARLIQHPGVRETAVLAREDTPGSKRIVAYLVPAVHPIPTVTELRRFLEAQLPDYMIPAAFVTLDAMPLMPNAKINRQALPAPDQSRPDLDAAFIAPTTENEQRLADIWQSVLGLEQVGIHDNFFELGGDSILSIQVIARANQAGLHLTPRQFFAGPTVAQLAAAATAAPAIQAKQGAVTGPVPLTPIQHWFFEQDLPHRHHWNQALLFTLSRPLPPDLLETAVSHLVTHHDALRLRFHRTGSG